MQFYIDQYGDTRLEICVWKFGRSSIGLLINPVRISRWIISPNPCAHFCIIVVCCGIWDRCIMGFVRLGYLWWRHQAENFSTLLAFVRGIHRSPVNSPHKGQWRGTLMFLICSWTNGWVNNRDAGNLRCHRAHYDVTVMCSWCVPDPMWFLLCPHSNKGTLAQFFESFFRYNKGFNV